MLIKLHYSTLQWRHNECDGISNHRHLNCFLNCLFGRRSKKTSNLGVTGLCEGNPPVTGGFPSQRASNAENVSIWWRHNENGLWDLMAAEISRYKFKGKLLNCTQECELPTAEVRTTNFCIITEVLPLLSSIFMFRFKLSSWFIVTLYLKNWGRDKMAAIFADNIFICIFLNENFWISNRISLKNVPQVLIDNTPSLVQTRHSEKDNTRQPLDQWTNSPFIGQQVGNCKSFTLTHYLANLFAMHRGPMSIPLCIQHHIQLTSLSFQVSQTSHSWVTAISIFYLGNPRSRSWVRSKFKVTMWV